MARELKIAETCCTFINKNKVRELIKNKDAKGILLITEKLWAGDSGKTLVDYYHCAWVPLLQPHNNSWLVCQARSDMTISKPENLSDAYIDEMRGYFLVFC